MIVTRYKPLFSFAASYELAGIGISSDGMTVDATTDSLASMADFKLKPQFKGNIVTVFFEGKETPANAPVSNEPSVVINTNQYFYLTVGFSNKDKIKGLKVHSSDAVAKDIGYPVLYNALIPVLNGVAGVTIQEDVKITTPVFTFTVTKAESGLTAAYATLEIRDEANALVNLNISPVALNDKNIDGISAVPEFAFSVDASNLLPGIYTFRVGGFTKKFFIAANMDITNAISLVRVLKNNFLEYKTSLADNSFARFELLIPKA